MQRASTSTFLALLAAAALPLAAPAQEATQPPPEKPAAQPPAPKIDPLDITGRSFSGIRFPSSIQTANLSFSGARVFSWTEESTGPGTRATQRLLLHGDAVVEIGVYRFSAAQAAVWLEPLGVSPNDPAKKLWQVAAYFDRVSNPGAEAGFAQAGDRLLVTGVVEGEITMRADSVVRSRPTAVKSDSGPGTASAFLRESEQRLAAHLRKIAGVGQEPAPAAAAQPAPGPAPVAAAQPSGPIIPGLSRPFEPNSNLVGTGTTPADEVPPPETAEPIFAKNGVITFAVNASTAFPGEPEGAQTEPIKLIRGQEDNVLLLAGGVVVQYSEVRKNRSLQITAQRAVVFLAPGPLTELARFSIDQVKGIYLEGDAMATDGQYNIRGPRMYYDVQANQAYLADAVFWTYDAKHGLPIYVRAQSMRQLAANEWSATKATLASTSFFDPVFAIGTTNVTITQREVGGQAVATHVDAKGIVPKAFGLPFMYFPHFAGDLDNFPIKDIRIENSSESGAALKTAWDIFGLASAKPPEGMQSYFLFDFYFDRGPAFGNDTSWEAPDNSSKGRFFGYLLPDDYGEDVLSSGVKRGRDHETRGIVLGEHRWDIDEHWTVFLEGSYVSDENFVDAFFKPLAQEGRELTNAAYLRDLEDNTALTFLVKGELNDFTPNQYLLQSQGYNTDKVPELAYYRLADAIFPSRLGGMLTYSSEYRFSRMQLNFTEPTANELGFDTVARARAALGILPGQSPGDVLRAQGFSESAVMRFDTRHELDAVFDLDPFKISPFIVGRFTGYDDDFEQFSGKDDQYRVWYAAGATISTELVHVDDSAESSLFDVHRTRHIIEPNATVWYAGATLSQEDLPVYDDSVESLATGAAVKAGINQTWQTQRGGPGQWRSVDFLTLRTDIVFSSHDVDRESPIERFFDYRPEYSLLGDFFSADATWQVTDAVALAASTIYDLEIHQPATSTAGGLIQHSPDFSTFGEVRYINALNATYVDFGASYRLTRRYSLSASATYDTDLADFQSFSTTIRRHVPEATIGVSVGYNNITDETGIGVVFEPAGQSLEGNDRLRDLRR